MTCKQKNERVIWLKFPIVISYLFRSFDFLGRLSFDLKGIGDMTNLESMHKEIDIFRMDVEFQKKLIDYWERRWKQEYAEKIGLLHKNGELEKKYKGIPEEVRNKFELVHSPSQVESQDLPGNQVERGEGSSHDTREKRKATSEDELAMKYKEKEKIKNGHFKKRCMDAKCEICNKIHTGLCYLKIGAYFKCCQLGNQVSNCPR